MISTNVFVDLQLLWLASLALLHAASGQEQLLTQTQTRTVRLVLMPKSVDNPFFDPAGEGCMDKAASITRVSSDSVQVTCNYTGPPDEVDDASGALQAQMVRQLLADNAMDALAISVRSVDVVGPAIQEVLAAGIPVVTFDSDAPDSGRLCFIGTDNYFFGSQIGKLLKQLKPTGGTYGLLYSSESLNLQQRAQGFTDEMDKDHLWTHVRTADIQSNITQAMIDMYQLADLNLTAIAPVMGMPMRSGTWKQFVDDNRRKNITYVSGDAMPNQIEFLERGYVHGLVGQLPYDFGAIAAQTLYDAVVHNTSPPSDVIGTNVLTMVQVPLVLPELNVNNNLIDQFHYVGFILCGVIVVMALGFAGWTYRCRNINVVKVAQPMFLIMIATGTLVLASALLPLSFDDHGKPSSLTDEDRTAICMSTPWLASSGFTITFSALFAKTWRVNQIFHTSSRSVTRVTVTVQDVLVPFFVLFTLNTLILALWTALDPLMYERHDLPGTDGWNRVIATYGSCRSHNGAAFLAPLAVVNVSVLLLANWQVYQARRIESEFAESKYIAIAMASLLQAVLSGIPILAVVLESPQAYYLVLSFMIFIICAVVLLVIFVPKMVMVEKCANETPAQQKQRIMTSIRQSRASISGNQQLNSSMGRVSGVYYSDNFDPALQGSSRALRLSCSQAEEAAPPFASSPNEYNKNRNIPSSSQNETPSLSLFEDCKSELEASNPINETVTEGENEDATERTNAANAQD